MPQPAAISEAAARERRQKEDLRLSFERIEEGRFEEVEIGEGKEGIGHFSFCVLRRLF